MFGNIWGEKDPYDSYFWGTSYLAMDDMENHKVFFQGTDFGESYVNLPFAMAMLHYRTIYRIYIVDPFRLIWNTSPKPWFIINGFTHRPFFGA